MRYIFQSLTLRLIIAFSLNSLFSVIYRKYIPVVTKGGSLWQQGSLWQVLPFCFFVLVFAVIFFGWRPYQGKGQFRHKEAENCSCSVKRDYWHAIYGGLITMLFIAVGGITYLALTLTDSDRRLLSGNILPATVALLLVGWIIWRWLNLVKNSLRDSQVGHL